MSFRNLNILSGFRSWQDISYRNIKLVILIKIDCIESVLFMKERISDMSYTTVEIEIPEEMKPYIEIDNVDDVLRRNALLLYPHVLNKRISHGRAAEILGIPKLDLIDLYAQMGFCYFDQTMDKLDKDLQTFKELGLNEVPS